VAVPGEFLQTTATKTPLLETHREGTKGQIELAMESSIIRDVKFCRPSLRPRDGYTVHARRGRRIFQVTRETGATNREQSGSASYNNRIAPNRWSVSSTVPN